MRWMKVQSSTGGLFKKAELAAVVRRRGRGEAKKNKDRRGEMVATVGSGWLKKSAPEKNPVSEKSPGT